MIRFTVHTFGMKNMFIGSCFIRFLLRKAQICIQCSERKLSVNVSSSRNANVGSATVDKRKYFIVPWAILEMICASASIRSVCLQVNPLRQSSGQSVSCSLNVSSLPQSLSCFVASLNHLISWRVLLSE